MSTVSNLVHPNFGDLIRSIKCWRVEEWVNYAESVSKLGINAPLNRKGVHCLKILEFVGEGLTLNKSDYERYAPHRA